MALSEAEIQKNISLCKVKKLPQDPDGKIILALFIDHIQPKGS
jgi:hypothetical protein